MHRILGASLVLAAALAAASTQVAPSVAESARSHAYAGAFAIPGERTTESAMLTVTPIGPLQASLDLVERSGNTPIRAYDVEMTKQLHLVMISDDFSTFAHLHPDLKTNGHFTLDVRVPRPGRYYLFADGEPRGYGKSVFRFAVPFGSTALRTPALAPTGSSAIALPYKVTLDSLTLHANADTTIGVRVDRDGRPASDLTPYLGGAAHAVFIDGTTLAYVHVHPSSGSGSSGASGMSDMAGMSNGEMADLPSDAHVPPTMQLHVGALPAGRYKLWLQFRGANALHVASFVLTAK